MIKSTTTETKSKTWTDLSVNCKRENIKEELNVGYRAPLKLHTVLAFDGITCHIEEVVGQGANAIVYKGWYWDGLNQDVRHQVLIKELFPSHPQEKIWRSGNDDIIVEPEAEDFWKDHQESFEIGNRVHLRLLYDHPELMVMGANLNSYHCHGTLYSLLGYTGGRSLLTELKKASAPLRSTARRMIHLLNALEAFHKSGYLHLDISPDNIMLVGQGEQERLFLIDYNNAREIGSQNRSHLSHKKGYSAPEISTGNLRVVDVTSDLYSVAAVFYRCLMGRTLTLSEIVQKKAPDGHDSPALQDVPQSVKHMVGTILRKGLDTLPNRRYQSIRQMRNAFQELIDRIDCVGVTHWSLWENGKRSVEELIRNNPSLRYLEDEKKLYPIRLEQEYSMSLERYLDNLLSPEGKSGMIVAQGGMGKTTLLLHTAMLQEKRYSSATPAIFFISLNGWNKADTRYISRQILMRLNFKKEENTFDSAMHALHKLLEQPTKTKQGEMPTVLLLLDGLNEVRGDIAPLVREINELNRMAGVRILATSRSKAPELELETARLMPLNVENIVETLGRNGLLIPQKQEVIHLLRTPLVLSIYIQTSVGGKQLDIENEEQLMKAYMESLLEKEVRQLPEDSPQRWQIDATLNYVLPAVAIEMKRKNSALSREQLLKVVTCCWNTLNTRAFRKTYPRWIGHSADIRVGADTAEEWLGIVIDGLLWKRLGILTKDDKEDIENYHIFHQKVAEHLERYRIPMLKRAKWIISLAVLLLCVFFVLGYQQYTQQKEAEEEIKAVMELGAAGYGEYGRLYKQLRDITNDAVCGDAGSFLEKYDTVLSELQAEQEQTKSEARDVSRVAQSGIYDQMQLNWGEENAVYAYSALSTLFVYPDERSAFYAEKLPFLKSWIESEAFQEKVPEFGESFLALLEADADLVAETYHIAVGIHLPQGKGHDIWVENIHDAVALADELEMHRKKEHEDDRGSRLSSLKAKYLDEQSRFNEELSRLNRYIKNIVTTMQTETIDIQIQLTQISETIKADNLILESECIDSLITQLEERQKIEQDLMNYFGNYPSG